MHSQRSQPPPPDHGFRTTIIKSREERCLAGVRKSTSPSQEVEGNVTKKTSTSVIIGNAVPGDSNCDNTERSDGQDFFMRLPAELRNRVYSFCLTGQQIDIRQNRFPNYIRKVAKWTEPGLLTTTKLIRDEATTIYYSDNVVTIHLKTSEFPSACRWLAMISRRCGARPFRFFRFMVMCPRWHDLEAFPSLAHLYFDTNIELANVEIADIELANVKVARAEVRRVPPDPNNLADVELAKATVTNLLGDRINLFPDKWPKFMFHRCSMFLGPVQACRAMLEALRNVLELGRKARQRKWSRAFFEMEMDKWLEDMESTIPVKSSKAQKAERMKRYEEEAEAKARRERSFAALLGR
jgi:hypothetical protein